VFDRLEDRVDDVAVEIVEEIDECEQAQDVRRVRPGAARGFARVR